jgi:hypothetical protein
VKLPDAWSRATAVFDDVNLVSYAGVDRAHHRPVAVDSDNGEAMKLVTRGHQTMIWERTRHDCVYATS